MSGPNSKRTDVAAIVRFCKGIASLIRNHTRARRLPQEIRNRILRPFDAVLLANRAGTPTLNRTGI
jgi:hypothetical protein